MDLPLVSAVSGVLTTALNAMKYVREVSDSTDDLELKSRINDLYTALLDVRAKVLELDEENRRLNAQLTQRDGIEGPDAQLGYFYFKNRPNDPICPKCYQSAQSRPTFMGPRVKRGTLTVRSCPVCNFSCIESRESGERWTGNQANPWS